VNDDEDYYVQNAVGHLVDDLNDDASYELLSEPERWAALAWVANGLIACDGIEGWIESLGQRSDDLVHGLREVDAWRHAAIVESASELFATRNAPDADARLAAMHAWSAAEESRCRGLEREFFALCKRDPLDPYLRRYIATHRGEFPMTVDDL
jgi:3-methyladenine DNA glycosylase AlkC